MIQSIIISTLNNPLAILYIGKFLEIISSIIRIIGWLRKKRKKNEKNKKNKKIKPQQNNKSETQTKNIGIININFTKNYIYNK